MTKKLTIASVTSFVFVATLIFSAPAAEASKVGEIIKVNTPPGVIDNAPEEKERGSQALKAISETPNGDKVMRILKKKLPGISAGDDDDTPTPKRTNKAELIDAMASKAGLSKADAKKALDGFTKGKKTALNKADRLSLIGFGSFSVSKLLGHVNADIDIATSIEPPNSDPVVIFHEKK